MNKKSEYHLERVPSFEDRIGIRCCECPKCRDYIPNVEIKARFEEVVTCPKCGTTFRLVKIK